MGLLLSAVSGFVAGVFLRSVWSFGWQPTMFVVLVSSIFAAAAFLTARRAYTLAVLFCMCLAFGMFRTSLTDSPPPNVFMNHIRHAVSYDGVVVSDPDLRDATQRLVVHVEDAGIRTNILVSARRYPVIVSGDRVQVSGILLPPQPFNDNGRTFQYDKYLQRDGVRFVMNFASVRVIGSAPWYSLTATLARVKHLFLDGLAAALPEPYAALAGGIVIGGKTGLGTELQDAFVRSGLVQIIVLSGYNVMVVAEWVMTALAYFALSRRLRAGAGAVALLFFVGVAGASATAIRAALMALIALFARATGRSYTAGRALLVAIFIMLLWNPLYLAFDPGFGLSVVATAGLIWLAPLIEARLSFVRSSFWQNAVATTLAAQTAVLPLLLYETGNLSLVAIPANLLVMPIVPAAMGFAALAGVMGALLGSIAPLVASFLALPAYLSTAYLLAVARISSALPLAAFTLPPLPFWLAVLAYAFLIYVAASKRFSITPQLMLVKKASM